MTLLQRVLAEKRGLVTVISVILVVDVGVYAFAVYPWTNSVSQSEARRATADRELSLVAEAYAVANQASSSRTALDGQLERFYTEVLPSSLSNARNLLNPYLDDLADETNLVLERRISTSNRQRESLLAKLETTMVLAGAYRDIREFIYRLETAPEFILIEEVLLTQVSETDEALVLTLGVSTYYREEPMGEGQPAVIAPTGTPSEVAPVWNVAPDGVSTDLNGEATVASSEETSPPRAERVSVGVEAGPGSVLEDVTDSRLATSEGRVESGSALAEPDSGEYAVQVAAFTSKVTATALAERLAMQGYPSYVVDSVDGELPPLYRVRIGTFSDQRSAEAMGQRVQNQEELEWFVVPQ